MGEWHLRFASEVGLTMQIPKTMLGIAYADSHTQVHHATTKVATSDDWCSWSAKGMVTFDYKARVFVSIGYALSSLDVYAPYRDVRVEGTDFNTLYPAKRPNHSVFIRVGGYF